MRVLSLEKVTHRYRTRSGEVTALREVDLRIEARESVAVLGPSGCGKSTLLRIIDGLLPPTSGTVRVDGRKLTAPRERTALILQDLGLLPWKTVLENACVGQEIRGVPKARARAAAMEFLHKVELEGSADLYPQELSGGMRQRLAIARAMILGCDLLLMDEPLSALDALLRERMQRLLLDMQKTYGYAQVVVTHSIEEAALLGKKIVVMAANPGRIVSVVDNPGQGGQDYRNSGELFEMTKLLRALLRRAREEKPGA